ETAIRAESFSKLGRTRGFAICIARDRGFEVWKVATIGPRAAHKAIIPKLGVTGSWMCKTSKFPCAIHLRVRAAVIGPKLRRATDPLYLKGTVRPAGVT